MVNVALIVDRSELAEWLIPEFRAAGLAVKLATPERGLAVVTEPLTVCVADRDAVADRGVSLLRATRAEGLDIPFVFIDPTRVATRPPPWEGRGVRVVEPFDMSALVECVRGCARRLVNAAAALLGQDSLQFGEVVLDCGRLDVFVDDRQATLTPAQFAFIYHLAQQAGRFRSNEELTQALFGRRFVPGEKNIAYLVNQIRRKVGVIAPSLAIIESKTGVGYRFVPPRTTRPADAPGPGAER